MLSKYLPAIILNNYKDAIDILHRNLAVTYIFKWLKVACTGRSQIYLSHDGIHRETHIINSLGFLSKYVTWI